MIDIKNALTESGWYAEIEKNKYDAITHIYFHNECYNGIIVDHSISTKKKYLVRIAITEFFDRWANSGSEEWFSNETEVINYLCGDDMDCIYDANMELTTHIFFESDNKNRIDDMRKVIEFVSELTKWRK